MRVYRNNKQSFGTNVNFPMYKGLDNKFRSITGSITKIQPVKGLIVETGQSFETLVRRNITVSPGKYYRMAGVSRVHGGIMWQEVSAETAAGNSVISVFDIMEATYTGQDMGERSISASIKYHSPIDFRIGDYVEIELQDLQRYNDEKNNGGIVAERFYIYTEPTCKKTARPMSVGDAFETTVKFYPPQYELACIQMRDFIQQNANADTLIYTGFDGVNFFGGAKELMDRCMACLAQQYVDNDGNPLWSYVLADAVNEEKNTALERYNFSFKGNSVMDAIMKLNDDTLINTTFFINDRTIYVGFKRPYICQVNASGAITDNIYKMMYGKTSHLPINIDHGGLFDITKTVSNEVPITKLFAYGANRNLNRYYCSDRIKSGRFVNHLMLPSFSDDGRTDYIISEDGVEKYGIREGSKEFEEVYPSLRYMTYADIRGVKYCIKIKTNGLEVENTPGEYKEHVNDGLYPITRLQCYKVEPCTGVNGDGTVGVNKLVECAPPEDIAVFVHATGKVVKCIIYGDDGQASSTAGMPRSVERQLEHDVKVPTLTYGGTDYIEGSCFAIHDVGWADMDGTEYTEEERDSWFSYSSDDTEQTATLHRIEYTDTFWITDLYVFNSYDQEYFPRDGYSAWAWPRLNNDSGFDDSLLVNEIMAVEPITIVDTAFNEFSRQHTFDIYIRDLGFKIDEQNDFGEMVFIFDSITTSMLDGLLGGREFHIAGSVNDHQDTCVCAYNEDGTVNPLFEAHDSILAATAKASGAIWRLTLTRENDSELQDIGLILPTKDICAKQGDHFVLLDIYMPDIYIRAAENRLLKEAQKYLDRNDRGNAQYAVSLDKVRMQQVPNLALQMREGVLMRLMDDDLNIASENNVREIFKNSVQYQVPLYTVEQNVQWENKYNNEYFYGDEEGPDGVYIISSDRERLEITLALPGDEDISELEEGTVRIEYFPGSSPSFGLWRPINFELDTVSSVSSGYIIKIVMADTDSWNLVCERTGFCKVISYTEKVATQSTQKYSNKGMRVYATCDTLVEFLSGKYYDIELGLDSNFVDDSVEYPDIYLSTSKSVSSGYYIPDYTFHTIDPGTEGGKTRVRYSFYLDESFSDASPYYISIPYIADGESEYATIDLYSITEKDLDEEGEVVNYADFTAESVTIKISDNSRPAASRIIGVYPQPTRELSATLKEKCHASSWASLQQRVDSTEIEVSRNQKTVEFIMNEARQNYQTLLTLRNSIFDPDTDTNTKCDYNFLHVMMFQVGADSMNYQLDKTFTTPTGIMSNFNVTEKTSVANGVFSVDQEDRLHHFVYTQGSQGGNWTIPGSFSKELEPGTDTEGNAVWPVYYVCIRCKKDGQNDLNEQAWICSTKQYSVNDSEDTTYWYFNWGILTCPNNDGNYVLSETRGNAYMYGDNIICGKIGTIAGNSYFDLTHGNFVLSQGDVESASLSYIDGVLTIAGVNDGSENSILTRLGLIEEQEIGGENLLYVTEHDEEYEFEWDSDTPEYVELTYYSDDTNPRTHTFLPAGKYVFSAKSIVYIAQSSLFEMGVYLCAANAAGNVSLKLSLVNGTSMKDQVIELTEPSYIVLRIIAFAREEEQPSLAYATISNMMLQRGTKSTTFNSYYNHITNALKGSTEIAGGLTMTNLLMLKDEDGNVKAGMSGLTDNSTEQGSENEGVTLWSGGTYEDALAQAQAAAQGTLSQLATLLPILLTKNGPGSRIGCFNVDTVNQVSIIGADGTSKFIFNTGDANTGAYMSIIKNNLEVIRLTSDYLEPEKNIFILRKVNYSTYQTVVDEGASSEGLIYKIMTRDFATASSYNIYKTDNVDYIWLRMRLGHNSTRFSYNIDLSFDIYVAGKLLKHVSGTGLSDGEINAIETVTFQDAYTYQNPHTGSMDFDIRNITIVDHDYPNYSAALSFKSVTLGTYDGNNLETWEDGEVRIYTDEIYDKTIIGRNGISVNGGNGTNFSFLNKDSFVKFFAYGMQRVNGDDAQVTQHYTGLDAFRAELKSASENWSSWNDSDQKQFFTDLYNALPDDVNLLRLN